MRTGRALVQLGVVCRKELKDSFRDRRALGSIVFSVLIGPILIAFMMNRLVDQQRDADSIRIPVVGAEHAPALVDWLAYQHGVTVADGPLDAERAVREQVEALVLIVPENFADRFRASQPAPLQLVSDGSRSDARPAVQRVRALLQQYAAEIGSLRLIVRGVSPTAVRPLAVEEIEVSTAQQRAAQILGFIPMFIMVAGFVAGMQIATDSTAGERERGSLEPLLVNPAPRGALVAGKWLAASAAAFLGVALTTLLSAQMPRVLPLQDMGVRLALDAARITNILLIAAPLCLFSAALQTSVATLARSFKEAQSYMGVLILAPMVPGIMGALYPLGDALWMYAVPMLGPYKLLTDVLGSGQPRLDALLVTTAVSLLAAGLLLRLTTGLFRSEHVIFGR